MSAPTLDLRVIEAPYHPAEEELDAFDPRLQELADAVLKGGYDNAAQGAQLLIQEGYYDIRLISYLGLGYFRQAGLPGLGGFAGALLHLLTDGWEILTPSAGKLRAVDSALDWLFGAWLARIRQMEKAANGSLAPLLDGLDAADLDPAIQRVQHLHQNLSAREGLRRSPSQLATMLQWLSSCQADLRRRLSEAAESVKQSQQASAAELNLRAEEDEDPLDDDDGQGEDDPFDEDWDPEAELGEDEPDEDPEADEPGPGEDGEDPEEAPPPPTRPGRRLAGRVAASPRSERKPERRQRGSRRLDIPMSQPMEALIRKLGLFEQLLARGDFVRADVVARDVEVVLEGFDPRQYLPSLFVGYYRGLVKLAPQMEEAREVLHPSVAGALERLYQVDAGSFVAAELAQGEDMEDEE